MSRPQVWPGASGPDPGGTDPAFRGLSRLRRSEKDRSCGFCTGRIWVGTAEDVSGLWVPPPVVFWTPPPGLGRGSLGSCGWGIKTSPRMEPVMCLKWPGAGEGQRKGPPFLLAYRSEVPLALPRARQVQPLAAGSDGT